jgi:tetratricopeptide (TPR) repeat protein
MFLFPQAHRYLAFATLLALTAPALGQDGGRYHDCIALAERDAPAALTSARAWLAQAPTATPARHCLALAMIGVGEAAEGAAQLARLAADTALPAPVRGDLHGQAGNGWLIAGRPDFALAAFDSALVVHRGDIELLIDRARAHAGTGDYWSAVADLDAVLDRAPARDDALAFRAAAYRRLEVWELAADDAARALAANPANVDALVERAILRLHGDDESAARADFSQVLLLAPESAAADLARRFLAELPR